MRELTISQVARQVGVRPSTIRYYESINVLPPPARVSGQRRYDATILDRLTFIQVAQKLGFTLTEIRLLFHDQAEAAPLSERWQILARQKLAEVNALITHATTIRQLLEQGVRCGCPNLFDCIQCVLSNCAEPKRAAK